MSEKNEEARQLPRLRMPAEWSVHESTWLSWPHNPDTWPGALGAAEEAMAAAAAALAESEIVRINVLDAAHERHVRRKLEKRAAAGSVVFHRIKTNDAWIRDYGAIIVEDRDSAGRRLAVDFEYNAWGGKYPPYDCDVAVGREMARILSLPAHRPGIILEGGSIDVNGAGALITTTQCLLNKNRNPTLRQAEIEAVLRENLGAEQVVWLGDGIAGDDTDGHVDDITRFVGASVVVTAVESDRRDCNYEPLAANRRLLEQTELDGFGKLDVIDLPMPEPQYSNGERLPASYANFYIANELVIVPTFACPQDEAACAVLQDCFPGRAVIGVDCRALVQGLGALHCLTQQVPAASI